METFIVGTIVVSVVTLFAATSIMPMIIELSAKRPTAHFEDDQIISIDPVGLDRPAQRPISHIPPSGAPVHREAA